MDYPLAKAFQSIEDQGLKRTIAIVKLALKEMPRLQAAFMDPKQQNVARVEILWLFEVLDSEMRKAQAFENMNEDQFNQALYKPENFSKEEWAALNQFRSIISRFSGMIFKESEKVKKPKIFFPKA